MPAPAPPAPIATATGAPGKVYPGTYNIPPAPPPPACWQCAPPPPPIINKSAVVAPPGLKVPGLTKFVIVSGVSLETGTVGPITPPFPYYAIMFFPPKKVLLNSNYSLQKFEYLLQPILI